MKNFHRESISLCKHPECSCCSRDMLGKPAAVCAVYDSAKHPGDLGRYLFPFLHYVCEQCYTVLVPMWHTMDKPGIITSPDEEVARLFLRDRPSWSLMLSKFIKPWYPFYHLDLRTRDSIVEWDYFLSSFRICSQVGLSTPITDRILRYGSRSRLQEFATLVNSRADIWYWEAFEFSGQK